MSFDVPSPLARMPSTAPGLDAIGEEPEQEPALEVRGRHAVQVLPPPYAQLMQVEGA